MATSGDYRNYFKVDGVRYSHTIDPRTGRPITHSLASVTVLAPTCAEADAWATALSVLGAEQGLAVAEQLNLPVYMLVNVESGFKAVSSSAFDPYLNDQ
jgi:thiamine biosynthesis lipoprotein